MKRQRTVCQEIRALSLMLKRLADSTLSELFDREITDVQGRVIGFLYHNQDRPIYQKDVEAEFSITRATTSKMLTLMEKNGLIPADFAYGQRKLPADFDPVSSAIISAVSMSVPSQGMK